MADKESNDVLMTFIDSNGNGVAAECTSVWDPTDPLMKDFQAGEVFEIDDFDFAVNLGGSGAGGGEQASSSSSSGKAGENSLHAPPGRDGAPATQNAENKKAGSNSKLAGDYFATGNIGSKPEVKEVTITKQVDAASITFLSSCLSFGKKVPPPPPTKKGFRDPNLRFQKAVLVKRKFTGRLSLQRAFLRLEFTDPLIIGIDWDEGEIVKEKIKFICREILVAYSSQNQDGTLWPALTETWSSARQNP